MHVEVNVLYDLLTMFDDDAAPIEPCAVSKALQYDLKEKGLEELTGLLCFLKVTTRKTLATLGDRHFQQICSTAQAASTAPGLMVALRDHRRALAKKAREAADTASTAEGNAAVEKALLAIAARATRQRAVELLSRDCPARERMAAAYHKLHAFTSTSEEDLHAGAQAAADAYIEHRAAMLGCPPEMDEFLKDAAVPVRDAVVLSCLSLSGYRNRDDFANVLEDVFGRVIDDDKVDSQLHNTYSHLMGKLPGAFASRSKMRPRRARQRVVRATGVGPEQADGEAPDASPTRTLTSTAPVRMPIAALTTIPEEHVQQFQPAYTSQMLTPGFATEHHHGGYGPAPGYLPQADYYGYQHFESGSAGFPYEDYEQVEPNQAIKDPLNGAKIRRLFDDGWYGGQVISIFRQLSTEQSWYTVRYRNGATESLPNYIVQQGVRDLHGPPPLHADPGMLEEHYAEPDAEPIAFVPSTAQGQLDRGSDSQPPTESQTGAYKAMKVFLQDKRASTPSERAAEFERPRLEHNGCPAHVDPIVTCAHCRLIDQRRNQQCELADQEEEDFQHALHASIRSLHADNSRIPIPSFVSKPLQMQNDADSENTDEEDQPLESIEEELPNYTSKLQEYLVAAHKETLRLRSGIDQLVASGNAGSTTGMTSESDHDEQEEQRFHQRLSTLTDTLNTELASLTPFKMNLWLGSA